MKTPPAFSCCRDLVVLSLSPSLASILSSCTFKFNRDPLRTSLLWVLAPGEVAAMVVTVVVVVQMVVMGMTLLAAS